MILGGHPPKHLTGPLMLDNGDVRESVSSVCTNSIYWQDLYIKFQRLKKGRFRISRFVGDKYDGMEGKNGIYYSFSDFGKNSRKTNVFKLYGNYLLKIEG